MKNDTWLDIVSIDLYAKNDQTIPYRSRFIAIFLTDYGLTDITLL